MSRLATPPGTSLVAIASASSIAASGRISDATATTAFPRSESGRTYPVTDAQGRLLAHAALASRKDVRDAVSAARAAFPGWSGATAYNRGQVLYRVAEMLQGRHEQFAELLRTRIETLRVGDPLDKNTDVGAINSRAQLDRIVDLAAAGDAEGAQRWTSSCPLPERGLFFPPTVFSGVEQTMRVAREEIFGPVLSVLTFRTPDEAVEKANNTPYGLSAGVWTDKGSRILWMAERLRAGVVWANTYNRFDPASPFGGYRESGFGREGGRHGLEPYVKLDDA